MAFTMIAHQFYPSILPKPRIVDGQLVAKAVLYDGLYPEDSTGLRHKALLILARQHGINSHIPEVSRGERICSCTRDAYFTRV